MALEAVPDPDDPTGPDDSAGPDDPEPAAAPVDGRTARRDRNRTAVLDAVLELFAEGHLRPSATEVAERSGVSLRSVFRYFEDTEELLRAALARSIESTRDLFEIPDLGEGPLDERIDGFVARRSRLFDAVAPTARATLQAAPRNRLIREQYELVVRALHDQTEAMFAPELEAMEPAERRAVLAAVDTLTQFPGFDHLRTHEVRTAAQGDDALRRALYRLLGDR